MPNDTSVTNGWNEWSRFVLKELERLNTCYESIRSDLNALTISTKTDITSLQVKSGIWGFLGGAILVGIALLVGLFKR